MCDYQPRHVRLTAISIALALALAGCPGRQASTDPQGQSRASLASDTRGGDNGGGQTGRHRRGEGIQGANQNQSWWSRWFGGGSQRGGRNGRNGRGGGRGTSAIAVQVTPAKLGQIQTVLSLGADIQPYFETPVSSKVGGRLESLLVDVGSKVRKGQLMATIDQTDYQIALQQAQATLASAEANLATARTNYDVALDTLKRTEEVYKEGGVADQTMVATRQQVTTSKNAIRSAEAQVMQAHASLASARANLAYTRVTAPYAGAVSQRLAAVGTLLGPQQAIFSVATVDRLKLSMALGEVYLASVHRGSLATFKVPTYPDKEFGARVTDISPEIDTKLRTATITFEIDNPQGLLAPGMYARMSLPIAHHDRVVVMPATTIVTDGEDSFVYEVKDGTAVKKPVKIGLRSGDEVEITQGVADGDPVITLGQGLLQDGDMIRVANTSGTSDDGASGAARPHHHHHRPDGARQQPGASGGGDPHP